MRTARSAKGPNPSTSSPAESQHQGSVLRGTAVTCSRSSSGRFCRIRFGDVTDTASNGSGDQGGIDGANRRLAVARGMGFRVYDGLQKLGLELWVNRVAACTNTECTRSSRSVFFKVLLHSDFSQGLPVDAGVNGDGQEVCARRRVVGASAQTRWPGRVRPR